MEEDLKVIEGEIVPIYENNKGERLINARELHDKLNVGRDFTTWIKDRIKKYNFDEFVYRFIKSKDLIELLKILNKLYVQDKSSLEELFFEKKNRFQNVCDYFYSNCDCSNSLGFCFMFAKTEKNSALKRMNMFLRWMVRDVEVDF